ncbi:MAG: DUF975 family protein [Oscillospiraceae bacterium]|nr:DUF975 family protein [Oscillospiraceae bacterium]
MNIAQLKDRARETLRYSYWWSVMVSFLTATGSSMILGTVMSIFYILLIFLGVLSTVGDYGEFESMTPAIAVSFLTTAAVFYAVFAAVVFFIINPLKSGHVAFYVKAANNDLRFGNLFDGFRHNYTNKVKTMFLYTWYIAMWIVLWSLLFGVITAVLLFVASAAVASVSNGGGAVTENMADFLSGESGMAIEFILGLCPVLWSLLLGLLVYMKKCQYFMVEYIIAENPEISSKRAFEISKKTMRGQKFNLFMLDLSFIGWYLLGYIVCFMGLFFVVPYHFAAKAQCYLYLKDYAVRSGYAEYSDFSSIKANIF